MIEVYASVVTKKKGSGYGAIIRVKHGFKWEELWRTSGFIETAENEVVIFICMYEVLEWMLAYDINRETIIYRTDNSLRSMDKNPLTNQIKIVIPKFKNIRFEQISREDNIIARNLASYQVLN